MLFPKISSDSLWSNFEEGLGIVDTKLLYNDFYLPHKEDREEAFLSMTNDLQIAFRNWIINLKGFTRNLQKRYILDEDDFFISFNYTDILETLYGINDENILHIHGYAEPDEQDLVSDYIFGHSNEEKHSGEDIYSFDYLEKDFVNGLRKVYQDNKLTCLQKSGRLCKDVIILGHSLNQVDDVYFTKIQEFVPNARWHIGYFDAQDYARKMKNIARTGISNKQFDFIRS